MITIKNLRMDFGAATPLKDVNAEIHKGDVIAVIGPSGTGKSTLLRCINMLNKPTSGQIIVNGVDLTAPKADILKARLKISMVFQSFNLWGHRMAVENVMMPPMDLLKMPKAQAFKEACQLLKRVGLGEKLYAYPDELSGGQKQRVAIARALAMNPDIILFDEPTSALDPTMVSEVQGVIADLAKKGLTMMVVTHDMKFSREIANRVFYMDEGIIYEDGSPEQIFDNPKRDKTRAFVKRLKTMEYDISSKDFDLYGLFGKIESFGKGRFMPQKKIKNTQLVIEELVINNLINRTDSISVNVGYFEADGKTSVTLYYSGNHYNPFEDPDGDMLSLMLVEKLSEDIIYSFEDGKNKLTVELA